MCKLITPATQACSHQPCTLEGMAAAFVCLLAWLPCHTQPRESAPLPTGVRRTLGSSCLSLVSQKPGPGGLEWGGCPSYRLGLCPAVTLPKARSHRRDQGGTSGLLLPHPPLVPGTPVYHVSAMGQALWPSFSSCLVFDPHESL